jgi:hypothetical protein
MPESARFPSQPAAPIPEDDPRRSLTVANPDSPALRHVSVAGGTYTILVSGAETAGRYCLIDMHVPDGGGPPPHRHDSKRCFPSSKASLNSPSVVGPPWCGRDRP